MKSRRTGWNAGPGAWPERRPETGMPKSAIETMKQYQTALPVDNLICRFKFPGIMQDEVVRSKKLFAEKVLSKISWI